MARRESVARVLPFPVRRQRPRAPPRARSLGAVALKPRREDRIGSHLEPVDSRRTLRIGLDLEA